jgi:nucleotide-binding universal stress UspA family protein
MRTLLIPLDGSTSSTRAFETALKLAAAESARVAIWSIVDPLNVLGRTSPNPLEDEALASARAEANRIVADATQRAKQAGIAAEGHVGFGEPALEIVARAKEAGADAIVMGTHGRSGFKRLFMGSVAESVLRSAPCPVVVVREPAHLEMPVQARPPVDRASAVCVVRLVEVDAKDFDRVYGEIATFMQGTGSELPGFAGSELFGSEDATRIVIVVEFRTHDDWSRAQWDERLGELLEELVGNTTTLDFNLYRCDRFPAGRQGAAAQPRAAL